MQISPLCCSPPFTSKGEVSVPSQPQQRAALVLSASQLLLACGTRMITSLRLFHIVILSYLGSIHYLQGSD
jgi:hypothetical protein